MYLTSQSRTTPLPSCLLYRTVLSHRAGFLTFRQAEEYSMQRLCMDDLLAECIALKGFGQVPTAIVTTATTSGSNNSISPTTTTSPSSSSDGGEPGRGSFSPSPSAAGHSDESWPLAQQTTTTATPSSSTTSSPSSSSSSSSSSFSGIGRGSDSGGGGGVAAAIAAAAAVTVAANLPDGEYPPESSSLRIIGEKYGCVIDVVGEAAAAAAVTATTASANAFAAGRLDAAGVLEAVGSATPVGHQDILIWGPAGVVREAKRAVCSLVSGRASAEVVVGAKRIERRDRGFWVNCEVGARARVQPFGCNEFVCLERGSG